MVTVTPFNGKPSGPFTVPKTVPFVTGVGVGESMGVGVVIVFVMRLSPLT